MDAAHHDPFDTTIHEPPFDATEVDHVAFGSVLGEDHKVMKSRAGASLKTFWNLEDTLWKLYSIHFSGLRD